MYHLSKLRRAYRETAIAHSERIEQIAAQRAAWRMYCRTGMEDSWPHRVDEKDWNSEPVPLPGPQRYWDHGEYQRLDTDPSLWFLSQMETAEERFAEGAPGELLSIEAEWGSISRFEDMSIRLLAYVGDADCDTHAYRGAWYSREFKIPNDDLRAGGRRCATWLRAGLKSLRMQIAEEY